MANDWEKTIEHLVATRAQANADASAAIAARNTRLADNAKAFDEAVRTMWEPVLVSAKKLVAGVATADIVDKSSTSSNGTCVGRTYGLNVRALPLPGSTDTPAVAMLRFLGDFDTGLVSVERPSVSPHAPPAPLSSIAKDAADRGAIEVTEKALKL